MHTVKTASGARAVQIVYSSRRQVSMTGYDPLVDRYHDPAADVAARRSEGASRAGLTEDSPMENPDQTWRPWWVRLLDLLVTVFELCRGIDRLCDLARALSRTREQTWSNHRPPAARRDACLRREVAGQGHDRE
jgi:hypothetical protein